MTLASGTKLGPHEILSVAGAGGMGEVYRARDTRLDRTVAIKILPQHLSENAEAKERFDREARAISSLSHPNICHLYDVGQQDGISYLVMEYLEGETLADRLRKGPLPLDQVLKIGTQICEGLEKAHRSGVVHRDLKPSNVMLTKSGAKLMDFGLAKAPAVALGSGSSSDSLATMSRPLTKEGTIVGTFQYMSPEQLEGKDSDARSDIFALGAVLYEMTTGKRAFDGKTTASTIAAIIAAEPKPISVVQPTTPPALDRVIQGCLAKDPDERLQTAHDVKLQLKWIAEGGGQSNDQPSALAGRGFLGKAGWMAAGVLLLILMGAAAAWWTGTREAQPTMYFNSPVPNSANDVALSADGRTVAMVAYSDQANKYMIWIYPVGTRTATTVAGTEDASHPFWSPDGRSLGFFAQGKLKTVEVSSGRAPQVLCDAPNGRGGTWNKDGVILFTPGVFAGIFRISPSGGTPVQVTKLDEQRGEESHRWPYFLPDGHHFLYLAANFGGKFEINAIFVGSLDSGEKTFVVNTSSNAAYAAPGYLLYARDNALLAQRFDLRTHRLSGEPRTITDAVQYFTQIDLSLFATGGNGNLVVQSGKGADKSELRWYDRSGKQVGTVGGPGLIANPSLSPDGRRVAIDLTDRDARHDDIAIYEVGRDAMLRLTFGPGLNALPAWSPDGKRVAYGSAKGRSWGLFQKNSDGSGGEVQILEATGMQQGPWDWSRDGDRMLIWKNGGLWDFSRSDSKQRPVLEGKWMIHNAQFSPDGKWIAYASNETGTWEVYVSAFPAADSKWQVSRGGGEEPRWRRDGKEMFYLSGEGKIMAVPVAVGGGFEAGTPVALFQTHLRQAISSMDVVSYDVTAGGEKFLVNTKVDEPNPVPLSIILNFASELEK